MKSYMVMRDTSSTFHYFISCCIFYFCVRLHWIFESKVHESKVNVYCCTSVVQLSHPHWNEWGTSNSLILTFFLYPFTNISAQQRNIFPLNRCFEWFSDESKLNSKVSKVCNDISQKVPSLSVFSTFQMNNNENDFYPSNSLIKIPALNPLYFLRRFPTIYYWLDTSMSLPS